MKEIRFIQIERITSRNEFRCFLRNCNISPFAQYSTMIIGSFGSLMHPSRLTMCAWLPSCFIKFISLKKSVWFTASVCFGSIFTATIWLSTDSSCINDLESEATGSVPVIVPLKTFANAPLPNFSLWTRSESRLISHRSCLERCFQFSSRRNILVASRVVKVVSLMSFDVHILVNSSQSQLCQCIARFSISQITNATNEESDYNDYCKWYADRQYDNWIKTTCKLVGPGPWPASSFKEINQGPAHWEDRDLSGQPCSEPQVFITKSWLGPCHYVEIKALT